MGLLLIFYVLMHFLIMMAVKLMRVGLLRVLEGLRLVGVGVGFVLRTVFVIFLRRRRGFLVGSS